MPVPKMPPINKELMQRIREAWKDGLTKGLQDPEKYMYEERERMDKTKPSIPRAAKKVTKKVTKKA